MREFHNHVELWNHLINGGKIKHINSNSECIGELNNEGIFIIRGNNARNAHSWQSTPKEWYPYIEPKWYENIPEQGVLCWVWHINVDLRIPLIITAYVPEDKFKFKNICGSGLANAEPVKPGELDKYILQ